MIDSNVWSNCEARYALEPKEEEREECDESDDTDESNEPNKEEDC